MQGKFRKTIFWTHLGAGVLASVVIVMMSVTGVILTYDRQIKDWADHRYYDIQSESGSRLSVDELLAAAQADGVNPSAVTMRSDPDKLPMVQTGRRTHSYSHPYTGEVLGGGDESLRGFMSTMVRWHRWFDIDGDSRATARAITGAANLVFFLLLLTGIYLWLPPVYRWLAFRTRLFFNPKVSNAKARDYSWHHVFGFWSWIPLLLVVASALPISYTWAGNIVYFVAGEERPQRGQTPSEQGGREPVSFDPGAALSLHDHFEFAATQSDRWQRISVSVPGPDSPTVNAIIDEGSGGEPHKKVTLTLHRNTGEIMQVSSFADRTTASKALSFFRWAHTGEFFGIAGQTIAGLVSAFAVLMTWTGLALAWRRLISPLLRRRRQLSPGGGT